LGGCGVHCTSAQFQLLRNCHTWRICKLREFKWSGKTEEKEGEEREQEKGRATNSVHLFVDS